MRLALRLLSVPSPVKAALLSVLLFAVPAAAQLTLQVQGTDRVGVSPSSCGSQLTANWTAAFTGTTCSSLEFWATTAATCGDTAAAGDAALATVATPLTATTGQFTFDVSELPSFSGTGGLACGTAGEERDNRICGAVKVAPGICGSGETTTKVSTAPVVRYDGKAPPVPVIEAIIPLDGALSVRAVGSGDASILRVELRPLGSTDDFAVRGEYSAQQTGVRITDLLNDVEYEVRVSALDEAGNVSAPSASGTGTPRQSEGFFGSYKRNGGQEEGGCGAAAGAPTVLALLSGLLLSRRKK